MGKFAKDDCLDTMRLLNDSLPPETLPRQAELEAIAAAIGRLVNVRQLQTMVLSLLLTGTSQGQ